MRTPKTLLRVKNLFAVLPDNFTGDEIDALYFIADYLKKNKYGVVLKNTARDFNNNNFHVTDWSDFTESLKHTDQIIHYRSDIVYLGEDTGTKYSFISPDTGTTKFNKESVAEEFCISIDGVLNGTEGYMVFVARRGVEVSILEQNFPDMGDVIEISAGDILVLYSANWFSDLEEYERNQFNINDLYWIADVELSKSKEFILKFCSLCNAVLASIKIAKNSELIIEEDTEEPLLIEKY